MSSAPTGTRRFTRTGSRVYFTDTEGNDWEFVEYRSSDPAQRNDYALPDLS
jgi:hypothetical protein